MENVNGCCGVIISQPMGLHRVVNFKEKKQEED